MTTERASRVVVGFDGSDEATDAVRWGAAYAAQHGWNMLILTAVAISGGWSKAHDEAEKTYRPRLEAAASEVAERWPEVNVATRLAWGGPDKELLDAARGDDLLVVGNRGLGGFSGLLLGSVSNLTAGRGSGAVVVVPKHVRGLGESGPVVVGCDGSLESLTAARFAVEQARLFGTNVVSVRVVQRDVASVPGLPTGEAVDRGVDDPVTASVRRMAADAGVPVEFRVLRGDVVEVLTGLSESALMVVAGRRGPSGVRGMLSGAVSRALARSASCGVAIVRRGAERPDDAA